MSDEEKNSSNLKNYVSSLIVVGKDVVTLLRDSALFLLALLLLVFPNAFNTILTKAGFDEGSFAGFKWKGKLVNSDSALKEARASITELKSQLDKTSKALEDATSNNPALKNSLAKLQEENKQWDATATKVENSVATTIQSSAPLVNEAQASADTAKGWGVVFSGDATLDQAKPEIEAARNIGIPNPVIYFRNGWYRGVSLAETRPTAEQLLAKAKQSHDDAYIVNIATWCSSITDKPEYRECASP